MTALPAVGVGSVRLRRAVLMMRCIPVSKVAAGIKSRSNQQVGAADG